MVVVRGESGKRQLLGCLWLKVKGERGLFHSSFTQQVFSENLLCVKYQVKGWLLSVLLL